MWDVTAGKRPSLFNGLFFERFSPFRVLLLITYLQAWALLSYP